MALPMTGLEIKWLLPQNRSPPIGQDIPPRDLPVTGFGLESDALNTNRAWLPS